MTVNVGDVVRIVAEWDIPNGAVAQLVYHYLAASGTTATDVQVGTAAEGRLDAAWDQIAGIISQEVDGSTVETYLWDFVLNRWDGIDTRPLIGADGTSVGDMMAHGCAALIKIFTAAARRQGRKYVPGIEEGSVFNGVISGGAIGNLASFAAEMDDDLIAGGVTLEFGTFNSDPASPLFETFSSAIGTIQAENIIAYQRRRRPGTGI